MTPKERNEVRELIKANKGDKLAGVAAWLGKDAEAALAGAKSAIAKDELKYPVGWDAAFHNIIDEIDRHADDDAAEGDNSRKLKSNGKTKAKAK